MCTQSVRALHAVAEYLKTALPLVILTVTPFPQNDEVCLCTGDMHAERACGTVICTQLRSIRNRFFRNY